MRIEQVAAVVEAALAEDVGTGDVTTNSIVPAEAVSTARLLVKETGVVAGLSVAALTFRLVDPSVVCSQSVADGALVSEGTIAASIRGRARSILTAERTALNFLQRMSGIATLTERYVSAVAGTNAVILDTRKTAPGLRPADKWAVRLGGGRNHRMGLYDMVLIKDNHIATAGGITQSVRLVRSHRSGLTIEVEVRDLSEFEEALSLDVDRIMLDNMSTDDMRTAVGVAGGRVQLEASGGVNLQTVAEIASTGVDFISVGALTHSAKALDISLEIDILGARALDG